MSHHYWTVLTKKTHVDQETQTLVLGEVLEEIQMSLPKQAKEKFEAEVAKNGMVNVPFEYEIVSYLGSDDPKVKTSLQIELVLPNGHPTRPVSVNIDFAGKTRMRSRVRSNLLSIGGSGMHWFRIYEIQGDKKQQLAELPLLIKVDFQ